MPASVYVYFVFTDTKNCKLCDSALQALELIDDQTDQYGVHFVKINDKRLAKTYGITEYPTLTYFRSKELIQFNGDLENGESVLEFLISLQTMADRIEEVIDSQL